MRKENVSDKKNKNKNKNKIKRIRIKIRTKMIKILTVFHGNDVKFDYAVVDMIKLILFIYKNRKGKVTQSRLPTNTELIFNKLVLIKLYKS